MKIIITRHGQTNHNINNIIQGHDEGEINDKGYIQVVNLSKKLKNYDIDYIISSDIKRCRMTTEIINSYLNLDVYYETLIREKNNGKFVGKSNNSISWDSIKGSFISKTPPGGENLLMVRARVRKFIRKLENGIYSEDKTILLVSHGGYLKIFLGYILGMKIKESILKLQIDNCSISEIEMYKNNSSFQYRIKFLNNISHL